MMKLSAAIGAAGLVLLLWSFVPLNRNQAGAPAAATSTVVAADGDRGRMLFGAKGCATCHINGRASGTQGECCGGVGPDLTSYTNDPAFLRRWLAEPASVRPGTRMPDLNLSPMEIEDLIAFLNTPR